MTGAAAAATVGAAAACGDGDGPAGTADDPITIGFDWWGNETRADLTTQALALFEEKNPGIKVRPNFSDYAPHWESLTTRMASQDLPDVFQMDYPRLLQFGGTGMLTPLEGLVDTSDFRGNLLDTGMVDGELLAVPVAGNTNGLIYRDDWWSEHGLSAPEPGYTWDDYSDAIATLSPALGEEKWAAEDWTNSYIFLEMWLLQQGSFFYSEDGSQLGFTKEQLVEWWSMNSSLKADGHLPPADVGSEWDAGGMEADAIGSMIRWDNALANVWPFVEDNGGTVAIGAPPTLDPGNLGIYLKPSMQLVIAANSNHPEESGKLIEFLLMDPEAVKILGTNRGIPATNTGLASVELDPASQAIVAYEESVAAHLGAPPPPPPAAAGGVQVKYTELVEQVQYEEMTPEEAAERFFTEAETLFAAEQ
nr:extracellular solute-binding protein [Glycomyces sp. L485]